MSRPPRIDGFTYLGRYRYFVTFCTFDRRALFTDVALGQSVVLQFRRTCREKKFALLAYCLMPDHVHLLVEGRSEASDFRQLIKSMKQSTGQRFAAKLNHPLWQDGFHDRVLRKDDDARKIAKYIVENPIRADLVRSPLAYPLSGSAVWTLQELVNSIW